MIDSTWSSELLQRRQQRNTQHHQQQQQRPHPNAGEWTDGSCSQPSARSAASGGARAAGGALGASGSGAFGVPADFYTSTRRTCAPAAGRVELASPLRRGQEGAGDGASARPSLLNMAHQQHKKQLVENTMRAHTGVPTAFARDARSFTSPTNRRATPAMSATAHSPPLNAGSSVESPRTQRRKMASSAHPSLASSIAYRFSYHSHPHVANQIVMVGARSSAASCSADTAFVDGEAALSDGEEDGARSAGQGDDSFTDSDEDDAAELSENGVSSPADIPLLLRSIRRSRPLKTSDTLQQIRKEAAGGAPSSSNTKILRTRSIEGSGGGLASRANITMVHLIDGCEEDRNDGVGDDDTNGDERLLAAVDDLFDGWIENNELLLRRELGEGPSQPPPQTATAGNGGYRSTSAASMRSAASSSFAAASSASSYFGGGATNSSRFISSSVAVGRAFSSRLGGDRGGGMGVDGDGESSTTIGVLSVGPMLHLTNILLERTRNFAVTMIQLVRGGVGIHDRHHYLNAAGGDPSTTASPKGMNISVKLRMRAVSTLFVCPLLGEARCPQFDLNAALDPAYFRPNNKQRRWVEAPLHSGVAEEGCCGGYGSVLARWVALDTERRGNGARGGGFAGGAGGEEEEDPTLYSATMRGLGASSRAAASPFIKLFLAKRPTFSSSAAAASHRPYHHSSSSAASSPLMDLVANSLLYSTVDPVNYSHTYIVNGAQAIAAAKERAFVKRCGAFKSRQSRRLAAADRIVTIMRLLPLLDDFIVGGVRRHLASLADWQRYYAQIGVYRRAVAQQRSRVVAAAGTATNRTTAGGGTLPQNVNGDDAVVVYDEHEGRSAPSFPFPSAPPPPPALPRPIIEQVRAVAMAISPFVDNDWGVPQWEEALARWATEVPTSCGGAASSNHPLMGDDDDEDGDGATTTIPSFDSFMCQTINRVLFALSQLSAAAVNDWLATSLVMGNDDDEDGWGAHARDDLDNDLGDSERDYDGEEDDDDLSSAYSASPPRMFGGRQQQHAEGFGTTNPAEQQRLQHDDSADLFTPVGCHFTFRLAECASPATLAKKGNQKSTAASPSLWSAHHHQCYPAFRPPHALSVEAEGRSGGAFHHHYGGGRSRSHNNRRLLFSIPFRSLLLDSKGQRGARGGGGGTLLSGDALLLDSTSIAAAPSPLVIDAFRQNYVVCQALGSAVALGALLAAKARSSPPPTGARQEDAFLRHEVSRMEGMIAPNEWVVLLDGRRSERAEGRSSQKRTQRTTTTTKQMGPARNSDSDDPFAPFLSPSTPNGYSQQHALHNNTNKPSARELLAAMQAMKRRLVADKETEDVALLNSAGGGLAMTHQPLPSVLSSTSPPLSHHHLALASLATHKSAEHAKPIETLTFGSALKLAKLCALLVMQPANATATTVVGGGIGSNGGVSFESMLGGGGSSSGVAASPYECLGVFEAALHQWRQGSTEQLFPSQCDLPQSMAGAAARGAAVPSVLISQQKRQHPMLMSPSSSSSPNDPSHEAWATHSASYFYRLRFLRSLSPLNAILVTLTWLGLTVVKSNYGTPQQHGYATAANITCGDYNGRAETAARAAGAFGGGGGATASSIAGAAVAATGSGFARTVSSMSTYSRAAGSRSNRRRGSFGNNTANMRVGGEYRRNRYSSDEDEDDDEDESDAGPLRSSSLTVEKKSSAAPPRDGGGTRRPSTATSARPDYGDEGNDEEVDYLERIRASVGIGSRPILADVVIEVDCGLIHLMTPLACSRLYQGKDPMLARAMGPTIHTFQTCLRGLLSAKIVLEKRRQRLLGAVLLAQRFMAAKASARHVKQRQINLHQRFAALLAAKERAARGLSLALHEHHYLGGGGGGVAAGGYGGDRNQALFCPAAMAQRRLLLDQSITSQQRHKEEGLRNATVAPFYAKDGDEDLIAAFSLGGGGDGTAAHRVGGAPNGTPVNEHHHHYNPNSRLDDIRRDAASRAKGVHMLYATTTNADADDDDDEITMSDEDDSDVGTVGTVDEDPVMKALFGGGGGGRGDGGKRKHSAGGRSKTKLLGNTTATASPAPSVLVSEHTVVATPSTVLPSGGAVEAPPSYASKLFVATRGLRQSKFEATQQQQQNDGNLSSILMRADSDGGFGGVGGGNPLQLDNSQLHADHSRRHIGSQQPVFFTDLPPALRASIRHLLTLEANYRALITEESTISFEISIRQEYVKLFPLVGVQVDEANHRRKVEHHRWVDYLTHYTSCYGTADCAIRKAVADEERRARAVLMQRARVFTASISAVTEERKYRGSLEELEEQCHEVFHTPNCAFPPLLVLLVYAAETRHALTAPPPLVSALAVRLAGGGGGGGGLIGGGVRGVGTSSSTMNSDPILGGTQRGGGTARQRSGTIMGGGLLGGGGARSRGAPSMALTSATSFIRRQAQSEIQLRASEFVRQSSIRLYQECFAKKNEVAVRERSERAYIAITIGVRIVVEEEAHGRRAIERASGLYMRDTYLFGHAPMSLAFHERVGRERLFFNAVLELQALQCRIAVYAEEMQHRDLITCVGYCERRQVSLGEWHPPLSLVDLAAVNRGLNQALNDGVQLSRLQQIAQTGIRHVLSGLQKERDSVMGMISTIERAENEARAQQDAARRAAMAAAQQEVEALRRQQYEQYQEQQQLAALHYSQQQAGYGYGGHGLGERRSRRRSLSSEPAGGGGGVSVSAVSAAKPPSRGVSPNIVAADDNRPPSAVATPSGTAAAAAGGARATPTAQPQQQDRHHSFIDPSLAEANRNASIMFGDMPVPSMLGVAKGRSLVAEEAEAVGASMAAYVPRLFGSGGNNGSAADPSAFVHSSDQFPALSRRNTYANGFGANAGSPTKSAIASASAAGGGSGSLSRFSSFRRNLVQPRAAGGGGQQHQQGGGGGGAANSNTITRLGLGGMMGGIGPQRAGSYRSLNLNGGNNNNNSFNGSMMLGMGMGMGMGMGGGLNNGSFSTNTGGFHYPHSYGGGSGGGGGVSDGPTALQDIAAGGFGGGFGGVDVESEDGRASRQIQPDGSVTNSSFAAAGGGGGGSGNAPKKGIIKASSMNGRPRTISFNVPAEMRRRDDASDTDDGAGVVGGGMNAVGTDDTAAADGEADWLSMATSLRRRDIL